MMLIKYGLVLGILMVLPQLLIAHHLTGKISTSGYSGVPGHLGSSARIDPAVTISGQLSAKEDNVVTINNFTISDSDPSALGVLTLSAVHGTFSAAGLSGVTIVTGNGTNVIVLQGTMQVLNTYISSNRVRLVPQLNFNGINNVDINLVDANNNAASAGFTIDVSPVNDGPSITYTASLVGTENQPLILSNVGFADVDAGNALVKVTYTVPLGIITATGNTGVTVTGSGTTTIQLTGSIPDINAYVANNNISYMPLLNSAADVPMTININDQGNSGEDPGIGNPDSEEAQITQFLRFVAVNTPPTISIAGPVQATEDVTAPITGITIADVDADPNNVRATFTLPAGAGTLNASVSGTIAVGAALNSVNLTGKVADINGYLAAGNLTYSPAANLNGDVNMQLEVNDLGNTGSGGAKTTTATVILRIAAVNDAGAIPVVPISPFQVMEDVPTAITPMVFADIDAGDGIVSVSVSVAAGSGTITAAQGNSLTITGSGTNSVIINGTLADINTYCAAGNVLYTTAPNSTAAVPITVGYNDNGNTGTGGYRYSAITFNINVTPVNDAPEIYAPSTAAVNMNSNYFFNLASSISVSDVDLIGADVGKPIRVKLTATNGLLTLTPLGGITFISGGPGTNVTSMEIQGSMANLNAALSTLIFKPATNYYGAASITITADDLGNVGTGDAQTATKSIAISVLPPFSVITGVSSSNTNGIYKIGSQIDIQLTFDAVVNVTGTPQLTLNTGGGSRTADYISGSGTAQLTFRYIVQAGDNTTDLDYASTTALSLNGGTIKNAAQYDAVLSLPAPGTAGSLGANKDISLDGMVPVVTSVAVPAQSTTGPGGTLKFTVNTSEIVWVSGVPALTLKIGYATVNALYIGGSGSQALTFRYTVKNGDLDTDGIEITGLILNGNSITDLATNPLNLTLNNVSSTARVLVDGVAPVITSVAVPADATYITGNVLSFDVNFSELIITSGIPSLSLKIGDNIVNAALVSNQWDNGIAKTKLTFSYTVVSGDLDTNGIEVLALNDAGISDLASNLLVPGLNNVGNTSAILVDAIAPVILSVSPPAIGTYITGQKLSLTVHYAEPVTVTGIPTIPVVIGANSRAFSYASGSGTSDLIFSYLVMSGEEDKDGIAIGTDISLNSGTMRDAVGNNAILTLNNVGNTSEVYVDAVSPVVTSVNVPADKIYKAGEPLTFIVNYSEPVVVTGTPYISLGIGASGKVLNYTNGSGTAAITFSYTVVNGDEDSDGITIGGVISTAGATIKDDAGNNAGLTLNGAGATNNVRVDAVNPTITSVAVPAAKTYIAGQELNFTVNTSENVNLTGTPVLQVRIGASIVNAAYLSGAGTGSIKFAYMVASGDLDTDGIEVTALTLNGGSLQDIAGNDLDLTLNNIGNTSTVLVDAVVPEISSVDVPAAKLYKAGETLTLTVHFSKPVMVTGTPAIVATMGATNNAFGYTTGTGTSALSFSYTIANGDLDRDGITLPASITAGSATIRDAASNNANLTLHGVGATGGVRIDAVPPVVTAAQQLRINENSAAGTPVGTVAGIDPGSVGTLQQWSIVNNTDPNRNGRPAFAIDPATGAITVNDSGDLDYEKNNSLVISINVSDGVNLSAAENVVIYLNDMPEPPTSLSFAAVTLPENNAIGGLAGTLSATSDELNTSFTYSLVSGNGGEDNNSFTVAGTQLLAARVFDYETKSSYNIRVRVSTQAGEYLEKTFVVSITDVNEAPTLGAIGPVSYCASADEESVPLINITPGPEKGQTTAITATSTNPGLFSSFTVVGNSLRYHFVAGASGNASVTVTVKDNGGTANGGVDEVSQSFKLSVSSISTPVITSNKGAIVSKGDMVQLTATGGVTYTWSADYPASILAGSNNAVATVRPLQKTTYTVTAANSAGCTAEQTIVLDVKDDYKVDATNVLTPNGDGVNDRFVIRNIDSYPDNELKIFDRGGRLLYTKHSYQNEWGGTVNGNALAEGTYYYILDFGPGLPKVKGFITIIR